MSSKSPTRVKDDVYDAAQVVAKVMSRSAAEQVGHWARIGRELELSRQLSHTQVAAVLTGAAPYDDLDPREQALVRAEWDERVRERREQLDLAAEFTAAGRSWSELDEHGNVVVRNATTADEAAS